MPSIDEPLLAISQRPIGSIADVVDAFTSIDALLPDSDGLKWFNWLYLAVTKAVDCSITAVAWRDPQWVASLDVVFARLYLTALRNHLSPGSKASACWRVLFDARHDYRLARIQTALAGINAHINHDLAIAVVETCSAANCAPLHLSAQYADYTKVNEILDTLVEEAKKTLLTGLLGTELPCMHQVEQLAAAFSVRVARETAWANAEIVWGIRHLGTLEARFLSGLDGATALAGRGLLAPVGIPALS